MSFDDTLKGLLDEWALDMNEPADDVIRFYHWANEVAGPLIPDDRNINPFKYVKEFISGY